MTVLPIVSRELRVAARRPATYWSRTIVAAVMLLLAAWLLVVSWHEAPSTQARLLFASLGGAALFVCGLSGMMTTADTVSGEKREGTLGLLFLTPLRGYDVVLGKLCASSLTVLHGLLAITPIVALPMLLGGISAGEFVRVALTLLDTLWVSLCLALWISSMSRNEKAARGITLLGMLLLAGGLPLLGAWIEAEAQVRDAAQWFMILSPGYAYAMAWDVMGSATWLPYWVSMTAIHVSGWLFLALACWFTPRSWQDRPARSMPVGVPPRATGVTTQRMPHAIRFRAHALGRNAFFWLASRPAWRPALVWAALILLGALWVGLGIKDDDFFAPAIFVAVALLWNGLLKAWAASEATRQLSVDRKSGSIELMLSTPITVQDIARGQWLALVRQFGWPVAVTVGAELILMGIGLNEIHGAESSTMWVAVWLSGMVVLLSDLLALYAVGLWQSVAARGPAEAAGGTGFRILALPWILFGALGAGLAVADVLRVDLPMVNEEFFWLGAWLAIALGVDVWFGLRSWHRYQRDFRTRAADRWRRRTLWSWLRARGPSGGGTRA